MTGKWQQHDLKDCSDAKVDQGVFCFLNLPSTVYGAQASISVTRNHFLVHDQNMILMMILMTSVNNCTATFCMNWCFQIVIKGSPAYIVHYNNRNVISM